MRYSDTRAKRGLDGRGCHRLPCPVVRHGTALALAALGVPDLPLCCSRPLVKGYLVDSAAVYRPHMAGEPARAPGDGDVARQVAWALEAWRASGLFTEQTLLRTGETVTRFAGRLTAQGVQRLQDATAAHCAGFIDAYTRRGTPPELATKHARRTAVRMLFRTMREVDPTIGDPTLDLALPARTGRVARPLTDGEVTLARATTRLDVAGSGSLQRAVAWALAEATAITSEISQIRLADLDNAAEPRWVGLPGTRRVDARHGELSDWGSVIVARQVRYLTDRRLPASTLLTYRGQGTPGQHVAQAAVSNAISAVLTSAGLTSEGDVRPGSVRNWAGRRLYDGGMPLEAVARRMGSRSLDAAAEDIALDWRAT